MRTLVVLICSLALVSVAVGAKKEEKKSQPKKQAQTAQRAAQPTHAVGRGSVRQESFDGNTPGPKQSKRACGGCCS